MKRTPHILPVPDQRQLRLLLTTGVQTHLLPLEDIIWLEAAPGETRSSGTRFHLSCSVPGSGRLLTTPLRLRSFQEILCANGFHRLGQSAIINTAHIIRIHRQRPMGLYLSDGTRLNIPARGVKPLQELLFGN